MKDLTPDKAELDSIESASVDEIKTLQLERLKWTLKHAYHNVEFYRAHFDKADSPRRLKSLSDLSKFPFTLKSDLRENYPFKMFAVDASKIVRIHASSGTTGQPTVVAYTKKILIFGHKLLPDL